MASASSPQSLFNVFVYGSLLADDVVRALLKRLPPSSPAILHNFHRFSIKGRVYPAILPVKNKKVNGKVLSGITVPELDILDKFEDVEYERRTVDVSLTVLIHKVPDEVGLLHPDLPPMSDILLASHNTTEDSSDTLMVEAYIWADQSDPNLYGEWNFEEWEQLHKKSFLKMTMEFVEELEQPNQSGST